jgi:hypothetical protein
MRQQKNKMQQKKSFEHRVSVSHHHGNAENIRGMKSLFLKCSESCVTALLPRLAVAEKPGIPSKRCGWEVILAEEGSARSHANGSGANGFSGSGCLLDLIWMGLNGSYHYRVGLGWVC